MKFRRLPRKEVGIDLTALVDVVFLLLIFFVVSTSFSRETQLTIDLPEAAGSARPASEQQIEVLVDETGNYRVNGQGLVDNRIRTLQAAVYKISAGDTTLPMAITADADAAHRHVVRAMDAVGQMGFVHLSITTRQPTGSDSGG